MEIMTFDFAGGLAGLFFFLVEGRGAWSVCLTQEGKTDYEIGYDECGGSIEAVGSLFDESCPVFKECRDVCNCHE